MVLSPFAQQLQHFHQHRELRDVPKVPLVDADLLAAQVEYRFKRTLADDNDPRDYDPLPNEVFKWSGGRTTLASYRVKGQQRTLERTDVLFRDVSTFQVHQTVDSLEVFESFTPRDGNHNLECYRIDYKNPGQSFYQELWLPRISSTLDSTVA